MTKKQNEYTEIRNGLTNFLFSCLKAIGNEDELKSKHILISILEEEAIKLSKNKNGNIEMFAVKPLIKAAIQVYKNKADELKLLKIGDKKIDNQINAQINEYKNLIKNLETTIVNINI